MTKQQTKTEETTRRGRRIPIIGNWKVMLALLAGAAVLATTSVVFAHSNDVAGAVQETALPPARIDRYAIVVGINDYQFINGVSFAVNDASDWRNHLIDKGYTISYFLTDEQATEENIIAAIQDIVAQTDPDDMIAFTFSGHGSGAGGDSLLCGHDYSGGTNGGLTDIELQKAFSGYEGSLFSFLNACHSGGMDEVVTADPNGINRYMTTTCTADGYGYEESQYQNGSWTQWFLERALADSDSGHDDMEGNFDWASAEYLQHATWPGFDPVADAPQEFDGDPTTLFYF